jgi:protein-disulfide isomerase
MSESGKNRRDRAAAARDAANAAEKRRERMVRIVGAVVVVVIVVGIIAVAVVASKSKSDADPAATPTTDVSAPIPKTALPADDANAFGVPFGTGTADVPTLVLWEDFQCPACDAVEKANGAGITELAEEGKINLIWRPTTFLDKNLGNDSSQRATAAWGCAIDAGKAKEFHNVVFANQPEEGVGYTDETLIDFAGKAGITGADLDTFKTCYNDRKYLSWADNSAAIFYATGIGGTPFALLNGTEVPTATLADKAALDKLVADATAAMASSPAASASATPSVSSS